MPEPSTYSWDGDSHSLRVAGIPEGLNGLPNEG